MTIPISRRDFLHGVQGLGLSAPFLGLVACDGSPGAPAGTMMLSGATITRSPVMELAVGGASKAEKKAKGKASKK